MATINAATQQILNAGIEKVTKADEVLTTAKSDYNTYYAAWAEMKRQYDYHTGRGDTANALIVKPKMEAAKVALDQAKARLDIAKKNYDDSILEYQKLVDTLLPKDEQAIATGQLNATIQQLQAQKEPNYASDQSKYLLAGVVIAVIVVIVVVIRFRRRK